MSPSSNTPISRANLEAQTAQMNLRFDAIMLLLESHESLKNDVSILSTDMAVLQSNIDIINSQVTQHTSIVTSLQSTVADLILREETQLPTTIRSIIQQEMPPSPPGFSPTSSVTVQLEHRLQTSITTSVTNAIAAQLPNAPIIQSLMQDVRDLHSKSISPSKKTGFTQPESKDFHSSKLEKLLEGITLGGDSLLDLELSFDSILSKFEAITLTSQLYPKYKDLTVDFDFKNKLCGLPPYPPFQFPDNVQAEANYRSFGGGLRLFLLKHTTIPSATCPETALQLLSLRQDPDGFLILRNLVSLRSPQLNGKFKDYGAMIQALQIIPGEHIREFYSHAASLSHEITLAQLQDGSNAVLSEHFLCLLRNTNDFIILGEISQTWKEIQSFCRDPRHLTKTLSWTLESILRDLEIAQITHLSPADVSPTTLVDAHVAYGNRNQ